MSIFGNIMNAIFGSKQAAGVTGAKTSTGSTVQPISKADLKAILEKMDEEEDEKLDWNKSIVDLMKLLKLDSSLAARRQLARELGYTDRLNGSAKMNIWLHKQVMTKLAEGGGKMPERVKKA